MDKKDLSEQIVDNILRALCEFEQEIDMVGVVFGIVLDFDKSSLTDEERKKKVSEAMGIIVRTQKRLTKEQKKRILQRVNEKIFKFEVSGIPKLA
ncbi:MAG: hypothetical protein A3D41_05100 [Candidatus Sungbacteria bacterium RIFCSPHIGHO2_02_FULL_41_12b]|nr:MAG: hypothetical protein A3D41_05100 [Candidatus Sungbacteria bacterium RIFCSPHIGHO2_02_FULL_41_12b]